MQDLKPTSFGKTLILLKSQPLPGQITSLLHANQLALSHLGPGTSSSSNEKGSLLRSIRLDRGIDPALLATEACISLAQLYAIETGEEGLFYSPLLREQTARRVAHLLQVDWNNLSAQHLTIQSFSNVFHLPCAVTPIKPSGPVNTAAMFQKQDTFGEAIPSSGLSKSSGQSPLYETRSDQNDPSDLSALTPRRSKHFQWFALILIAYAIAVFVTLGFDALSTTQNALDTAMSKWTKWFVLR